MSKPHCTYGFSYDWHVAVIGKEEVDRKSNRPTIHHSLMVICPSCHGSGSVQRVGFSSSGHMDSGCGPSTIDISCQICKSKGWIWALTQEEMAQRIMELEKRLLI